MTPEFSHCIPVDSISVRGSEYKLTATDSQRAALTERLDIIDVVALSATVRLQPAAGGTVVRLSGTLSADVVQACGVTLQPVPAHIEESFSMTFAPDGDDEDGDIEIIVEQEDPPDPIIGGVIDIGEAVSEHLVLALDPFPRAPGAVFEALDDTPEEALQPANPFAVLARLQKK
jgi:uncharacterized metal-binding protein YceD (DUF177 family)